MKLDSPICLLFGLAFSSSLPIAFGTTKGLRGRNEKKSSRNNIFTNNAEKLRKLTPATFCGCSGCDSTALSKMAGPYSCGDRIDWLQANENLSERDACIEVAANEFPNECGTCNPETCMDGNNQPSLVPDDEDDRIIANENCGCPECDDVWDVTVDSYSCGQRIEWLQTDTSKIFGGPFNEADACYKVAFGEYPNECGKCNPLTCHGIETKNPTNTPTLQPTSSPTTNEPTYRPTQSPTNLPTTSPMEESINEKEISMCGCPNCDDSVLDTFAGEYTCRGRINWLRNEIGLKKRDACSTVAGTEFPVECGACDPDRCLEDFTPEFNNNNKKKKKKKKRKKKKKKNPPPSSANQKCGGAVNSSVNKDKACRDDLWNPTGDSTMYCFAYGGADDPCHLNNNNDPNDGIFKDPSSCMDETFLLWDEPDTQGKSYSWAGRTWLQYSQRYSNELKEMRSKGTKVTSPMLKAGGTGVLRRNLNDFFDACGSACFDKNDPAYVDVIAINAFCGDFNGPAGCSGGASFIYNEAVTTSNAFGNIPVYITNWSRLQTSNPQDQVEAIDAIDEFFPPSISDEDRVVQRVYWFGATDFGGGSSNNFLTNELSDGNTLGEVWRAKCESL